MHYLDTDNNKKLTKLEKLIGKNVAIQTLAKFMLAYTGLFLVNKGLICLKNFAMQQQKLEYLRKRLKRLKFLKNWRKNIAEYYEKFQQQTQLAHHKPAVTTTPAAIPAEPTVTLPPRLQPQHQPNYGHNLANIFHQFRNQPQPNAATTNNARRQTNRYREF